MRRPGQRDDLRALLPLALALATGCEPALGNPTSLVTGTRVLAVRGEPPDAAPGTMVHYDMLVASPQGTVASPEALWSYCLASLPPADNEPESTQCLLDAQQSPIVGPAMDADTAIPMNACELFGPEVPSAPPGQPPQAPAIPDTTGGYYEPVRVKLPSLPVDGNPTFGLERIQCGLASAPSDTVIAFNKTYTANSNPTLTSVSATADGPMTTVYANAGEPSPLMIPPGQRVTFTAAWPVSSAETFPAYDVSSFALNPQRESLRVSWYATSGAFDSDRTGRASDDMATTTANGWTAPHMAGVVHFWVVLRDSRGGVDFGSFDVRVGS
jgi:hypothetical protein